MRLLLLGKDGQVGRHLSIAVKEVGEVVALGRTEVDFQRLDELPRIIASYVPEVIVNAVAYTAVDKAEKEPLRASRINTDAVALLAASARDAGAWLVHFSTDYVFDGTKATPYVETDLPAPCNIYGITKNLGDLAIKESGCKHLIFRVSWVYGDNTSNFPRTILRLARDKSSLRVVGDQIGAPTSAVLIAKVTANAVAKLDGAGEAPMPGIYNLSSSGSISRADYARFLVAEARGCGASVSLLPEAIVACTTADYHTAAFRPLNSRLDTTKIRATFGVDLPDWREDARSWVAKAVEEMV